MSRSQKPEVRSQWLAVLAGMLLATTATAQVTNVVTVAWDANPEPDEPEFSYRIYYGPDELEGLTNVLNVANAKQGSVTNLSWGVRHWFYVTASNAIGLESEPSEVLFYTLPPEPVAPAAPAAVTLELRIRSATQVLGPFTNEVAALRYRHALPMELFVAEISGITAETNGVGASATPPVPGGGR